MYDYWSPLRAGLLALFVSGLIWIWAEGESLTSKTMARVEIELPSDLAGEFVIRSEDPSWNGVVQVRLEGSVRAVEAAAAVIGSRVRLPVGLAVMPKQSGERKDLKLADAVSELPDMANLRGVVAEVQPSELTVRAIKMITRDLPIRVELAREVALDGEPAPTPTSVRVRLPEIIFDALGEAAQAVATVSDESLSKLRNDGPQSLSAMVRLPGPLIEPELIAITPDTVLVSVRPRRVVDTARLPTVPVWFSLPPTEDGSRWNIEVIDKFLADVTVTGPSEEVRRVQAGELAIKAVVELSTDDLERGATDRAGTLKQASFVGVPGGLACAVAKSTVRIKITKRNGQPVEGGPVPSIPPPAALPAGLPPAVVPNPGL